MSKEFLQLRLLFLLAFIAITLITAFSVQWNIHNTYKVAYDFARVEANATYNKDVLYRRWASMHGGVYVPVSEETPANPILEFIPYRDIDIPEKQLKLTLVNPAYMTRQVHELAKEQYGVQGNITSLNPIRAENIADEWERNALEKFEQGIREHSDFVDIDGKRHLRYMHAMVVEESCMKCHATQGYQLGQVRGGVSVSVPLDKYSQIANQKAIELAYSHGLIYLLVVSVGFFTYRRMRNQIFLSQIMRDRILESEEHLTTQNDELKKALLRVENNEKKLLEVNSELEKANLRLQETEQRLDFALSSSSIGTWELNLNDHTALRSLQHSRIFGYTDLLNAWSYEIFLQHVVDEDRQMVVQRLKDSITTNKLLDFECRIRTINGVIRWIWINGMLLKNKQIEDAGKIIGIVQDITQRKEAEQKILYWKQLMEYIIKNDPLGVVVLDKNLHFVYTSDTFLKDYKVDTDIIGKHHYEVFPELPQKLRDVHQRALKGEVLNNSDDELSRSNGSTDYVRWECRPWYNLDKTIGGIIVYTEIINERKQSELALRHSEERFRHLFEHSSAIKFIINPHNGMIENANKAAATFYGWSVKDLEGMNLSELFILSTDPLQKELEWLSGGERDFYEYLHKRKDGTLVNVEIFSSTITSGNNDFLHMIIHDVTEKKKNEKLIRLLSSSIEQNPVSILITDHNGIIEYVNPAFSKVSGYSVDEISGRTPDVLSSGKNPKQQIKELWETILSGEIWHGELLNKRKDGVLYWINCTIAPIQDESGKITHFVSVREDITERKRLREEIQSSKEIAEQSEKRLKEAQAIAKMGNWELDLSTNQLMWSDEIFRIFDLKPHTFKATYEAFLEVIHPDDREAVNKAYTASLKDRMPYEIEHRLLTRSNNLKWVLEKCQTQFDGAGKPLASFGILVDITERKNNEKALEEINKSLQDMVYVASHDLQVPLVSMEGYASELLSTYKDKLDEDGVYCLSRLQVNAQRMHKLVLSLLDISRLNTVNKDYEVFKLDKLIEKITSDLALTIGESDVNIIVEELPELYADRIRIESVFRNLIINSIIYKGKTIVIGRENNFIYVKDDGIGIPESQLSRIFGPGERLKMINTEGVGMGLTFCKKVIEKHGGKIWASSQGSGKGATFFVDISLNFKKASL